MTWKLCYVDGPWAWFTTQALKDQWGDDWNDRPYEHNAGSPYGPSEADKKKGKTWDLMKIAYEGDFEQPSDGHTNSPWSVEDINAGAVAWIRTSRYSSRGDRVNIPAGVSPIEFCKLIWEGGGSVYLEKARAEVI